MDDKKYRISICIIARPGEDISRCLKSLERQTYPYSEIVVHREIGRFPDLRNKVIDKAKEEIIVFIDGDCYAEKHWLEEVNKTFQTKSIVGFYGKVCYDLNGHMPTISTRLVNTNGQELLTANAGFRSDIIKRVRFDESINYYEDLIIMKRMQKEGTVKYVDDAIVFHTYKESSFKGTIKEARKITDLLAANKKYGVPVNKLGPIVNPQQYLVLLFPPVLFLFHSIRSFKDLRIAFATYFEKVYSRFLIWKFAFNNRTFLL